jgi:hypothetical protein
MMFASRRSSDLDAGSKMGAVSPREVAAVVLDPPITPTLHLLRTGTANSL